MGSNSAMRFSSRFRPGGRVKKSPACRAAVRWVILPVSVLMKLMGMFFAPDWRCRIFWTKVLAGAKSKSKNAIR